MPKCQRDRLLLKWAPQNIRVGIDSKAAAAKINLVERRAIIGGHEGSGLFRTGSRGEGVVLLQVKLDWNPEFKVLDNKKRKNTGKNIYIQYTLATFKGNKNWTKSHYLASSRKKSIRIQILEVQWLVEDRFPDV